MAVKGTSKKIIDETVEKPVEGTVLEKEEVVAKKTAKTAKSAAKAAAKTTAKTAAKTTAKENGGEIQEAPKKKAAPRKTKAKAQNAEVYFQFAGQEIMASDIFEKAKAAFVSEGNKESAIETFRLYIKPEDNKAYYIVNDEAKGHVFLD